MVVPAACTTAGSIYRPADDLGVIIVVVLILMLVNVVPAGWSVGPAPTHFAP